MVKEIPEDVKAVLGQLTGPQQVTLRKYIATLRAEAKDLESELLALKDTDPNAHFHGGERCTSSHGHDKGHHGTEDGHNHGHEHAHKDEAPSHGHEHEHAHKEPKEHEGGHSHDTSHSHRQAEEHSHEHAHKEHKQNEGHSHEKAEHHDHSHGHSSDKMDEDIPAWKKRAMESGNNDPMAAPFGGNWNTESSLSASDDKMKE